MGFFDFFKPRETDKVPAGLGEGPPQGYADPRPPYPYLRAAPTYAQQNEPKLQQDIDAEGKYFYPPAGRPPEQWTGYHTSAVTVMDPQQHQETSNSYIGAPRKTMTPDPRWNPPEYRGIVRAPNQYSFTRPFDVSSAKALNGNHFSMADHPTEYQFTGITNSGMRRNTYRITPAPWDEYVVDTTVATGTGTQEGNVQLTPQTYVSPDAFPTTGRGSYRL